MTKGLKEGERLHNSTQLNFINPKLVNNKGKVKTDLTYIAKPTPATGLQKWQVGIYNSLNKKRKEKGLGRWIQRKIGKAPVLYDESTVERSRSVMEKYLQDNGYFGSTIKTDTSINGKKVDVKYSITSKGQYFIRNIYRPVDTLPITSLFKNQNDESFLVSNKAYNLAQLTAERNRLANQANDNGFYEITKDDFFYFVDTTAGNLQADIYLRLRQQVNNERFQIYYIDDTWVFPDHSLSRDEEEVNMLDIIGYNQIKIIQREKILRPTVLNRLVYQDTVQLFSSTEQQNTISRLLNLGIYKFADIRFEKEIRQDTHYLDRYVYLTPGLMRDFGVEFQLNSRSGNFLGTEISSSFSHKNAFKGAELFDLSLSTGIETNIGANAGSTINTLNAALSASLQLPGIYAPFVDRKRVYGSTLPRTTISIGDDFQQRTGFYTINSFNFSAGYQWLKKRWSHQFSPISINYINLLETSNDLDVLLNQNSRLRSSFENVLVLGANHRFSFTNQTSSERGNYFYYRGGVEFAGNLLNLIVGSAAPNEQKKILNIPFSQFLKLDNDFRQYISLRKGMLAGRMFIGVAYPYGNAEVMPYIKQYFIGGASSVRAFRIRTLGPGGFESKVNNDDGSNFVDQTGDIKLEMNLEYRFPIFAFLKGALFVDAGNVWLIRGDADDSTLESDGLFQFNTFYNEIAVGTGFGARIDFEVAVIRFDWAFPLRRPTQSGGPQWLFSEFDFLKKEWRKQNLVWNIAIGYPF